LLRLLVAEAFPDAPIIPVHCDGWAHFTESRDEIEESFQKAGLASRFIWLEPGRRTGLPLKARD